VLTNIKALSSYLSFIFEILRNSNGLKIEGYEIVKPANLKLLSKVGKLKHTLGNYSGPGMLIISFIPYFLA
jgi:hypothetical protein